MQQAGRFQTPVVEIESLYAPHYRANSASHPALTVLGDASGASFVSSAR